MESKLCRIAIFYDGHFFFNISNYYLYEHARKSRISFSGLHEYIRQEIAKEEKYDEKDCQIIDAAYFRGRLNAQTSLDKDKLFSDRQLEDVLARADITLYQRLLKKKHDGRFEEKGIDVWLALEAYEMASLKKYDVCVLIAGDSDFSPLIKKLNTLGSRVMVVGCDFEYIDSEGKRRVTRTAEEIIQKCNYSILLHEIVDKRESRNDPLISNLFEPQRNNLSENKVIEANLSQNDRLKGTILNNKETYAFIKPDGGGDNYFFPKSELRGNSICSNGDRVEFTHGENSEGLYAKDVVLLD